ncbi:endonuclease III domain-containing protein [Flavobacterium restrictum]|uniref:HhH-GPD domain-containing protein n=1 Tax=Flavobacterium restrictum TaxID=2594428 RepID=A0A553DSB5_9FLAO|nr:hypothetical protein [Flavobacterium restrictum]TRX35674.1 hypothetical protein FNW21_14490 [Flavobacterium restrictum]
MDLFGNTPNWESNLAPILEKYSRKKHPLAYQNRYQLMVMVLLSAQDSDANINSLASLLFQNFPSIESLSVAKKTALIPYIANVKNVETKANWLLEIAKTISKNENIPLTMEGLTALKGIGRKSANVILREANQPAVGIIVDLLQYMTKSIFH